MLPHCHSENWVVLQYWNNGREQMVPKIYQQDHQGCLHCQQVYSFQAFDLAATDTLFESIYFLVTGIIPYQSHKHYYKPLVLDILH